MTNYVVRIVLPDGVHDLDPTLRTFLTLLDSIGVVVLQDVDRDGMCFDLVPPVGLNPDLWIRKTVTVLADYGFNAVRAPACPR